MPPKKSVTTLCSNNPASEDIAKGNEITVSNRDLYSHIHFSTIHDTQHMDTAQMSVNRGKAKENVVLIYMEISFGL